LSKEGGELIYGLDVSGSVSIGEVGSDAVTPGKKKSLVEPSV
jgi:hypothetical protein